MENQVQTIVCPNCGASSSNLNNCDYCGSFLVRLATQGKDIKDYVEHSKQFHYEGLEIVVQKYFEAHKKLKESNLYEKEIGVFRKRIEDYVSKDTVSLLNLEIRDGKNEPRITLCRVGDGCGIRLSPSTVPYAPFMNSRCFSVFSKESITKEYVVGFGDDYKGATSLILQLLSEVFDIPYSDITYYMYSPFDKNWNGFIHWALYNNKGTFIESSRKGEDEFASFSDYLAKELTKETEKRNTKVDNSKKQKKGCAGMLAFLLLAGASSTYGIIELIKSFLT